MWCGWRDSNSHDFRHWYLKPACIPISPHPQTGKEQLWVVNISVVKISVVKISVANITGVNEGDRTLDRRSHNPELYQLSYVHHNKEITPGYWYARQDSNLLPSA